MNYTLEPLTFTVALAFSAHKKAAQFQSYHPDSQKAEQIYYNTLAIYAVNFYLQTLQFKTNLESVDRWNPMMQILSNTAELEVKNIGSIECIPILEDNEKALIPPESLDDRVAYMFVQLNKALTEATVLGFLETVEAEELLLDDLELRAIDELPEYLMHPNRSPQEMEQDESLPDYIRRLVAQMLKDGWRKVENWADNLLPQQELSEAKACAASGIAEADLPFCKTVYLEESKQEIEVCTKWIDVSDLEPEFDISVLARAPQDNLVLVSQANSDAKIPEIHNEFLPIGLEISITFPDGEVHDSIKVDTQTTQVELTKLSVFGNTQFNIKISDSNFVFVESCRSPK
jgi:Protein of unknown function (DUF1822)